MASSINASTTTGLVSTADLSGILNLQSGGTTIATVQSTGFSLPTASTINAANTFDFKNRIINGGMTIDQRNAGASITPTNGQYSVDRWYFSLSQASKLTAQQNAGSVTPPAGFINYLGSTSSSAYTVGASEVFLLRQSIEGLNVADLGWGTANAKTVTLSFWARSSLTGTFGGSVINSAATRAYPFSYSIPVANTWTQISITIAGDTSGTWLTTNGLGLNVSFSLGSGSTVSGTAGSWGSTVYYSATGATSVVGTNGATFYITGVQLEVGSQATSFDFRDYGREFILCQRYYETGIGYVLGNAPAAGYYLGGPNGFRVTKRASPTVTVATTNVYATGNYTLGGAYVSGFNAYSTSTSASGLCETQGTYTASAEL